MNLFFSGVHDKSYKKTLQISNFKYVQKCLGHTLGKVYCLEPHARKFAILFVRMYMYYYYTLMWNFNYINMSDKPYVIKFVE